jgi:hypothetical protein
MSVQVGATPALGCRSFVIPYDWDYISICPITPLVAAMALRGTDSEAVPVVRAKIAVVSP